MVKVNLLPPEFSDVKKTAPQKSTLQRVPAFIFTFSLLFFLIGIFLWAGTLYRKKNLESAIKEYKLAQDLNKKIEALKKEQDILKEQINTLNYYLIRDFFWWKKLQQLGSLIPKEVWLKQLVLQKSIVQNSEAASLSLKGGLISQGNNSPIGTLSMFVNRLKDDREFSAGFDNPALSDFRTEIYKNTEITVFLINISLKKK